MRRSVGEARYTAWAMSVIIAMLRAVNVGGHNRIKMEELRALCGALKLRDAQTYVQSGNIVFRTKERDLTTLAKKIERGIAKKFGFQPSIVLRTVAEMRDVIARNPFAKRSGIEPNRLLVTFLAGEPGAEAREKVRAMKTEPEEMHIEGREAYLYFPNGMARPKLSWPAVERVLKVTGTARNWNSATKLLEMAEKMEAAE
jgi:uncharacterized protein (DUF1697 family)